MDRNVFVAIALSMSVLLFWGAFFETPKKTSEQQTNQKLEQTNEQSSIAPTINQPQMIKKITLLILKYMKFYIIIVINYQIKIVMKYIFGGYSQLIYVEQEIFLIIIFLKQIKFHVLIITLLIFQ